MLSCKEGKPEGYSILQANSCGSSKLDMCFVQQGYCLLTRKIYYELIITSQNLDNFYLHFLLIGDTSKVVFYPWLSSIKT